MFGHRIGEHINLAVSSEQVGPKTKDQGATNEPISKINTNGMA